MLEVELTSELLITGNVGMQDKKKSIDLFYEKWESSYPDQEKDTNRFQKTMNMISETFTGDELVTSKFRRPPLFYTLYCVVFHHMFGLPKIQRSTPRKRLTRDRQDGLKEAVVLLSEKIDESKDPMWRYLRNSRISSRPAPARRITSTRGRSGSIVCLIKHSDFRCQDACHGLIVRCLTRLKRRSQS